jgi:LAS superfamily LD-carboxypeptidase LdcB
MSSSSNITGLLAELINGTTETPTSSTSVRNLNPVSFSTAYYHSKNKSENNRTTPSINATKKAIVLKHIDDSPTRNSTAGSGTTWFSTMQDFLPRYGISETATNAISTTGVANYPKYRVWILPDKISSDSILPVVIDNQIANLSLFPVCSIKNEAVTERLVDGALIRIDFENRLLKNDPYIVSVMNNKAEFGRVIFNELEGIASPEGEFAPCNEQGVAVAHASGDTIGTAADDFQSEELIYINGDAINNIPGTTSTPPPSVVTCADVTQAGDVGPTAGIESPAAISDTDIATTEDPAGEPLYLRDAQSFREIGRATEFVTINGKKVIKEVAGYVQAMITAAKNGEHSLDGIESITIEVSDGFRTMAEQQEYWDRSPTNPQAVAHGVATGNPAARPGRSNHQNGIAIDFNVSAQNGRVFEWLTKNAWRYGFIRTVTSERWHWEYWGNWEGQEKPTWAEGWHSAKTMFSSVGRVHACNNMQRSSWWTSKDAPSPHSDAQTGGRSNSWIGFGNEHLPDKFDRLYPGWDST